MKPFENGYPWKVVLDTKNDTLDDINTETKRSLLLKNVLKQKLLNDYISG